MKDETATHARRRFSYLIAQIVGLAGLLVVFGWSKSADAASLAWNGTAEIIFANGPGAIYGSTIAGVTPFSGYVHYPDSCSGCLVEPFPPDSTNYVFLSGAGGLMGAGASSIGLESSVEITNDETITQDSVDVGAALGFTLPLGQPLDSWTASNSTSGPFGVDFIEWNISYVYWTTQPFTTTDYTPTPPANPDAIIFEIRQFSGDLFEAIGLVTSVPEPGFGALLGAGCLVLCLATAGRRGGDQPSPLRLPLRPDQKTVVA